MFNDEKHHINYRHRRWNRKSQDMLSLYSRNRTNWPVAKTMSKDEVNNVTDAVMASEWLAKQGT